MKVQVLEVSSYEREVEVELPPDQVRHGIDHALTRLKTKVKVPGFRKGKVPRTVLLKRYAEFIDRDAAEHLVEETFPDALARHGLIPVNEPALDRGGVEEGRPFKYSLRFEVMPRVEVAGYAGVSIQGAVAEVSDEAVADELTRLQEAHGTFQAVERPAAAGDRVTFKIEGLIDGEPLRTRGETDSATLGRNEIIPPLEAALTGARAGEDVTVDRVLEDGDGGGLGGRKLVATIHVVDVEERHLPALDDEFAKDQDHDDLQALRAATRERMEAAAQQEVRRENERRVVEAILAKNEFDIPPSMVRDRTDAQLRSAARMFADAGIDPRGLGENKMLRDRTRERVVFDTRRQVVVDSVARQERIEVTDADVEARIERLAEESKQPLPKVRARYAQGEGRAHLERMLKAERVLDFLLSRAKIEAGSGH